MDLQRLWVGFFTAGWTEGDPLFKWTNELLFAMFLVSLPRTYVRTVAAARLPEVHPRPASPSVNDKKPLAASVTEALSSTLSAPGPASSPNTPWLYLSVLVTSLFTWPRSSLFLQYTSIPPIIVRSCSVCCWDDSNRSPTTVTSTSPVPPTPQPDPATGQLQFEQNSYDSL